MADIIFDCPHCQKNLAVDEKGAGRTVSCPSCKKSLVIPKEIIPVPRPELPSSLSCPSLRPVASISPAVAMAPRSTSIKIKGTVVGVSIAIALASLLAYGLQYVIRNQRNTGTIADRLGGHWGGDKTEPIDEFTLYEQAGKEADSGDLRQAVQSYQLFIRNYPNSSKADLASNTLEKLSASLSIRDQQDKVQRELTVKIRENGLTKDELETFLHGKTKREITRLLGSPLITYDQDSRWDYLHAVLYPDSGHRGEVIISFNDGVVSGFEYR